MTRLFLALFLLVLAYPAGSTQSRAFRGSCAGRP